MSLRMSSIKKRLQFFYKSPIIFNSGTKIFNKAKNREEVIPRPPKNSGGLGINSPKQLTSLTFRKLWAH